MKKCPSCNRTYTDEALSFCLEDGSPLLSVGGSSSNQSPSFDPNATLQYNPARDTNPPPTQVYNPNQASNQPFTPMPTPSWSPTPGAAPPQKKSKAIYWILGGVGALVVVGIAGIVLLVVLVGSNSNSNNMNNSNAVAKNSNRNSNTSNANASNTNTANKNSGTSSNASYQVQDDFSVTTKWWSGSNAYGTGEYVNGEYQLSAAVDRGWVVVYGPDSNDYHTENVTTRVTTHSVSGTSPEQGYGLTVYGLLKDGNLEDYGFLIRTDENPAFRVVLHQGGKETVMVNWTRSSLLRTGSSPNQLEVRATPDQMSFYINGQFATSITDKANYKGGLVGFYTSDTEPVAFDDLEIVK